MLDTLNSVIYNTKLLPPIMIIIIMTAIIYNLVIINPFCKLFFKITALLIKYLLNNTYF